VAVAVAAGPAVEAGQAEAAGRHRRPC
jgi:hypothetical protein